jgi:hypothetical protein
VQRAIVRKARKDIAMNRLRARKTYVRMVAICLWLLSGALEPAAVAQNVSFKAASHSPVGVGSAPTSIAAGDFNGDGKLDLAVVNTGDNTVSILLGNGDGTFSFSGSYKVNRNPFPTPCTSGCGSVPIAIAVGDFNNDGKQDLAITNIPINDGCNIVAVFGDVCSSVAILLGKGDGTFNDSNQTDTKGHLPTSVAVGDFNGDGNQDLAITNLNSSNVEILLGDGKGNFNTAKNAPIAVGTEPTSVAVGDFNGDGKLDLAVANADDGTISILLGNGDGTFGGVTNFGVGIRPISIAVADFNGDGKSDIAVANYSSSTVSVLLGDGTGSFPSVSSFPAGRHPAFIAIGDFDRDGHNDLIVANRTGNLVSILLGHGDGTFAASKNFAVGLDPQSVAVGDFNQDSAPDFAAVSTPNNVVTILLNNTDTTPPITTVTSTPGSNANGWNNTSITVTLISTDSEPNGSGVKEIHYTIGGNPEVVVPGATATVNLTTEGIFSLSYFAVDNAGNVEAAHHLTIQIDLTPPTISSSQIPPANAAGWNNSKVTVSFACADNLSGVDTCTAPITVSTEGAGQVVTGTATDKAGNSSTASRTINLDKTPPVLTMPTFAPSYLLNASLTFNFGATDALSGVASMQATFNGTPITSGTTLTLTHLATNTFTLTATDVAGNTATQTATFAVVYNFIGFLPPIPNDGSGLFKLGRTVPVKFQLTDAKGTLISTAVAHLTIQMISGNTLQGTPIDASASGNADVGDLFRFDGTEYIFNWSTNPLSTGTWQLQARLDDGTVHTVLIGFK